jgi:hypothetical protein
MIKKLLTLIVIIGGLSAKAQQIIPLTINAQYFDTKTLEFFTPVKNKYTVTQLDFQRYQQYVPKTAAQPVRLKHYLSRQRKTLDSLVDLQQLKKVYSPEYGPQVQDLLFAYTTPNGLYSCSVKLVSPVYALIRTTTVYPNGQTGHRNYFAGYRAITINNLITIYSIDGGAYNIINTGSTFTMAAYSVYNSLDAYYRTRIDVNPTAVTLQEDLTPFFRKDYPLGKVSRVNGKRGLNVEHAAVLPPVYDSIKTTNSHIVTYRDNNIQLFYRNGDSIALKGIRAVYTYNGISVLIGNSILGVDDDGNLTPPSLTNSKIDKEPYDDFKNLGRITILKAANGWNLQITAPPDSQNLNPRYVYVEKPVNFAIVKGETYKSITFTDSTTGCECRPPYFGDYLLAETPGGQKALLKIKEKGLSDGAFENYQVVLGPDNYTFTTGLQFKKGGLLGYWPQNKEVRYTQLAPFTNGFARFTLPNGTQGWLAVDGTEYLDQ